MSSTSEFPAGEAVSYVADKQVTQGFSYLDVWREEHQRAFTVAKMMSDDLLAFMQLQIKEAVAQGLPFLDFQKAVQPKLMQAGWWGKADLQDPKTGEIKKVQLGSPRRLKLIYDQNMRTAAARQTWLDYEDVDAIPYLRYELGPSREHRPEHVKWQGLVLPKNDPFWTKAMPPNGYGCKCFVIGVTDRDLQQRGWSVSESPKLQPQLYVNKRTGEREMGYVGIQAGFAYNVGAVSEREYVSQIKKQTNAMLRGIEACCE